MRGSTENINILFLQARFPQKNVTFARAAGSPPTQGRHVKACLAVLPVGLRAGRRLLLLPHSLC